MLALLWLCKRQRRHVSRSAILMSYFDIAVLSAMTGPVVITNDLKETIRDDIRTGATFV